MELKKTVDKLKIFVYKYRYAGFVLLAGIVLMSLPGKKEEITIAKPEIVQEGKTTDEALEDILSCIDGAGEVRVLLTVASGEEIIYQTDQSISDSDSNQSTQHHTITVADSGRNESGLVRQVNPPVYQGAVVICQGADSPFVRLSIVNAVSKATGLGTDRISVLKMK